MQADLQSLLARVESGSGADRELDAAIEHAQRFLRGLALGLNPEHIAVWKHIGDGYVEDSGTRYAAPAYTTDLNAVVALVEARVGHEAAYMMLFAIMNEALFYVSKPIGPQLCRHMIAALIRAEIGREG